VAYVLLDVHRADWPEPFSLPFHSLFASKPLNHPSESISTESGEGLGANARFLDGAECLLLALDREGVILEVNQFGSEILGVKGNDALGKNWFDQFCPSTHRVESVQRYGLFMTEEGPGRSTYQYAVILGSGIREDFLWFHTVLMGVDGTRETSVLLGQRVRDGWSPEGNFSGAMFSGPADRTYRLSPKEREIAEKIRLGATSRTISEELMISRLTVDRHRNNIRRKLKVPHDLRLMEYLKLYL